MGRLLQFCALPRMSDSVRASREGNLLPRTLCAFKTKSVQAQNFQLANTMLRRPSDHYETQVQVLIVDDTYIKPAFGIHGDNLIGAAYDPADDHTTIEMGDMTQEEDRAAFNDKHQALLEAGNAATLIMAAGVKRADARSSLVGVTTVPLPAAMDAQAMARLIGDILLSKSESVRMLSYDNAGNCPSGRSWNFCRSATSCRRGRFGVPSTQAHIISHL